MQSITNSTRTFMPSPAKKDNGKPPRRKTLPPTLKRLSLPWLLVAVLLAFGIFMLLQYREASQKLQHNTPAAAAQQANDVIAKVRKLVVVPENETPTVVTVRNVDTLKTQAFFAKAKNGDKVVVYSKQKQAILYRPNTNQIVNISTVSQTTASP